MEARRAPGRVLFDDGRHQRLVDAAAFARDELEHVWNLDDQAEAQGLAALCAAQGAEEELAATAARLDDPRALRATAWALIARAVERAVERADPLAAGARTAEDIAQARRVARLAERSATRAGDLALCAQAARAGAATVEVNPGSLRALPVAAPFWSFGAAPSSEPRPGPAGSAPPVVPVVHVAPFAVPVDARPEDRLLARALAVHVADVLAAEGMKSETVVVAAGDALYTPTRPWDLPLLLALLPPPVPGAVVVTGALRRLAAGGAELVGDAAGWDRDQGPRFATTTTPAADHGALAEDVARRVLDALAPKSRTRRRLAGQASAGARPLAREVLELKGALLGLFLAAAGRLPRDTAFGAGSALLAAATLLDDDGGAALAGEARNAEDATGSLLALAAAAIAGSFDLVGPPALTARLLELLARPALPLSPAVRARLAESLRAPRR